MSRTEQSLGTTAALDGARKVHHNCTKAIKDLERATARSQEESLSRWATGAISAVFKLRESLGEHIAVTDAPGGLFEEILERAPRLAHEVKTLREDCNTLDTTIAETLVALTDPTAEGPSLVALLTDLLRVINAHRQKEADLVYEAYEVDIGAED
ncbi:MAG: hypothetical protein ACXVPP_07650 [Actinomycetota bacterium]